MKLNTIIHGDALMKLKEFDDNSVDACVTDPPYGIGFMGKEWDTFRNAGGCGTDWKSEETFTCIDGTTRKKNWSRASKAGSYDFSLTGNQKFQDWCYLWTKEVLRVLKPGGHLLSFGGSRTYHRMACAIEDAGFEIRDQIMWVYGSGFPKSLNIGKAIDKVQGNERVAVWADRYHDGGERQQKGMEHHKHNVRVGATANTNMITKGTSEWEGWGTALKPAHEPIVVARKPLSEKTVALNVLKWGTGGLNIDGCRISVDDTADASQLRTMNRAKKDEKNGWGMNQNKADTPNVVSVQGRFPANFIHDGSVEVLELFPQTKSGTGMSRNKSGQGCWPHGSMEVSGYSDSGSAARFFYCAKASKKERGKDNKHPTVKPLALMGYLIKLVTREGQIVLDPFAGSGSTLIACQQIKRDFIGIEIGADYCRIAEERLKVYLGRNDGQKD